MNLSQCNIDEAPKHNVEQKKTRIHSASLYLYKTKQEKLVFTVRNQDDITVAGESWLEEDTTFCIDSMVCKLRVSENCI